MQDQPPGTDSEQPRIAAARLAYADLAPRVVAGEPWPLAEAFGTEPEASWGPREVLAHVAEMLPFWLGELERVVDGAAGAGSDPAPFGRIADDPSRIGVIGRDRSLPLRVLFGRVDTGFGDWSARLATLTADERTRVGLHPRLGEVTVDRFLERFVIGHAEEHIAQIRGILDARPA